MKVRVRAGGLTRCLELKEEKPTLGDLRRNLSSSLLPSLGYSSDAAFTITLNGKDALTADEDTLESCGIISGDLFILLMPGAPLAAAVSSPVHLPNQGHCQPNVPPTSGAQLSNIVRSCQSQQREEPRPSSCFGAAAGEEVIEEGAFSEWLFEPMLISESTDGKIPHSLESLYLSAGCSNANDALMTVIHRLMVETGYIVVRGSGKGVAMPDEWRRNEGFYKICYTHPLCGDSSAHMICIPMGKLLIINARLNINRNVKSAKMLQLPTSSYIRFPGQENEVSSVFRDLQKLSRIFKDQLVYPLLAATRQALELPDVFGLLVLPLELKLRIFHFLDVRSLIALSATCKDFRADSEDSSLWKCMYRRDFKDRSSRGPETDWKELYKIMHKTKSQNQLRHFWPVFPPPFFSDQFPPYIPCFPRTPGIIGGDYDQHPLLPFIFNPIEDVRRPIMDQLQPLRPHLPGRGGSQSRSLHHRRAFI